MKDTGSPPRKSRRMLFQSVFESLVTNAIACTTDFCRVSPGAGNIRRLMEEYPNMPPKIRAAIKGGYNLQVRLQAAKSKAVNLQAALASVKSITTQLETSLTSMKKAGKAYDKAAAVLNHETGIYIQLTNGLTAQKQTIEKATKAVARYWQKEKIKTTPLG